MHKELAARYAEYLKVAIESGKERDEHFKEEIKKSLSQEKDLISARFGDSILLQGRFPPGEKFLYYDLYRKELRQDENFALKLNKKPLSRPFYTDTKVEPGKKYEYIFVGVREDATRFESIPIHVDLSKSYLPQEYIKIRYLDTPARDVIIVGIEKEFKDLRYEEIFTVKIGEELGRKAYSVEAGMILDFSTGLILKSIEEADEIITVPITVPLVDEKTGNVVIDPRTNRVLTKVLTRSFGRRNKRITLSTKEGKFTHLWQGETLTIPAR
jgi:hypothetical protein